MPSKAKMMRKRKSRSRREQIAFIELSRELTRSDKAAQCLETTKSKRAWITDQIMNIGSFKKTTDYITGSFLMQPTENL